MRTETTAKKRKTPHRNRRRASDEMNLEIENEMRSLVLWKVIWAARRAAATSKDCQRARTNGSRSGGSGQMVASTWKIIQAGGPVPK